MSIPRFVLPVPAPDAAWNRLFVGYLTERRPAITTPVAEQSAAAAFRAMFLLTPHEAVGWWDEAMCRRSSSWGQTPSQGGGGLE